MQVLHQQMQQESVCFNCFNPQFCAKLALTQPGAVVTKEMEMRTASPLAQITATRFAILADDTEISFQPGGGYIATTRHEHADGALELTVECFDRNGFSGGRQTAMIQGGRLAAQF